MRFQSDSKRLTAFHLGETISIEAWGSDALRVRATMYPQFSSRNWALSEEPDIYPENIRIVIGDSSAEITNGRIKASISEAGILTFFRDGKMFLREYYRNYAGTLSKESRCLKMTAREYKPYTAGDYQIIQRFESSPEEKIFGMSAFVKESLNQTFQDYVKTVRFHCACKMILNGDKSMQNVCVESGFSDYRYFSEVFRQRTGMTPEQYSHHPTVHMDAQQTHHSLHSLEHFYSRGKSLELLSEYKKAVM